MRVLLLAGTAEARRVARSLFDDPEVDLVASLSGATKAPKDLFGEVRVGGFGGAGGLEKYLREGGIGAVVDATHPFAARISKNARIACEAAGVPRVQLLRPPYTAREGDRWHYVADEWEACGLIPPGSAVCILTGRRTADRYSGLRDCRKIFLLLESVPELFNTGSGSMAEFEIASESAGDEEGFLERKGVDWLVMRDSGSATGLRRLVAARRLGLPVAIIRRPPDASAGGHVVETAEGALDWVRELRNG